MSKTKPNVGDELYAVGPFDNPYRLKKYPHGICVVSKVGRKYFTVNMLYRNGSNRAIEVQFQLHDWVEKTNHNPSYRLWSSKQAWLDFRERNTWVKIFRDSFGSHPKPGFSLEQLRAAGSALGFSVDTKL